MALMLYTTSMKTVDTLTDFNCFISIPAENIKPKVFQCF